MRSFRCRYLIWNCVALGGLWLFVGNTAAQGWRGLQDGERLADTRLGPLRGEQGDFNLNVPPSREDWHERSERVRQVLLVSMGLWPLPTRTPLNPVIHSRVDCGGYTVESVYFESMPGFFVTGNLYRPKIGSGKRPAVLSPHGHFPGGRFIDEGPETVRKKIAAGAERFEEGGRSFMQARCVQLARMGCLVFHYDMIGYGDCQQIPQAVAHRFPRDRIPFKQPPESGLYSAAAERQLQGLLGLHTWNSIRALDFLAGLSDVDPDRIAVTGGSGGGTQTFMLCAVDDRPRVSVPAVIVGTTRQGGCTCEHACGLRIGTYNLEFTALHAPKPLMLISADDSTRTMPERGYPEIQRLYNLLNAESSVAHRPFVQFPHNYNAVSRCAMYDWVNEHLDLGWEPPVIEAPYQRLTREQMTVWNDAHPQPAGGTVVEKRILDWWRDDSERQLKALRPRGLTSLDRYRATVGAAWQTILGYGRFAPGEPRFELERSEAQGEIEGRLGRLRYLTPENHRAELPLLMLFPKQVGDRIVICLSGDGKRALFRSDGLPRPAVRRLLENGATVIGVDLFGQGEFKRGGLRFTRNRILPNEDAFAAWTYSYNLPMFARRVHDIQAVIRWARREHEGLSKISVVGLNGAGPWVAGAVALEGGAIDRAAIHTEGFRFANISDIYAADFLPGGEKFLDLPGLLALAAPTRLKVYGESIESMALVRDAYAAAGREAALEWSGSEDGDIGDDTIRWLLE